MGDKASDVEHNLPSNGGSKLDWHHIWNSVENASSQAGNAIKHQVSQIDTKELADNAKHAASEGLKIARGKSDNKQVNQYSDTAAKYIPGAGLLRQGAEIAHETGAEGKLLEGKKGPLHAPSDRTLKEASSQAVGTIIPIPGGGILGNEILNNSGVKQRIIDSAFDTAKSHGSSKNSAASHSIDSNREQLPHITIGKSTNDDNLITQSKNKVREFFHSFDKK